MEKIKQLGGAVFLCALTFACLSATGRAIVLLHLGEAYGPEFALGQLLGITSEFLPGFLVSCGLMGRRTLLRISFSLLAVLVLALKLLAAHYEVLFHQLPTVDVLYYLPDTKHLYPSLKANIPIMSFIAELMLLSAVFLCFVEFARHRLRRYDNPRWIVASVLVCILGVSLQFSALPERYLSGSREVLIWMVRSHLIRETYLVDELQLTDADFTKFMAYHGREVLAIDPANPTCTPVLKSPRQRRFENVILLILEGVGMDEINKLADGQPLMPNLKRIVQDNLSFENFHAPGTKSVQSLPAIFSSLPAQPHKNYLWTVPLIPVDSLVTRLGKQGYESVYFHGGDLSFDQQRLYLQKIEFSEIIEYDSQQNLPLYGWGYDDGVMFDRLKGWIETHNHEPGKPYFATLFTLSTHDPYIIPNNNNEHQNPTETTRLIAAYQFLDQQLGEFYDWYLANEHNTLLMITSDHAPYEKAIGKEIRFKVPFILAGLSASDIEKHSHKTNRLAASLDIMPTLAGLLGQPAGNCVLGLDLLVPDRQWASDRMIYATSGVSLEELFFKGPGFEIVYDRVRTQFRELRQEEGETNQYLATSEVPQKILDMFTNLIKVHYYLLDKRNYYPAKENRHVTPLPRTASPLLVSHRGNLHGPSNSARENSAAALDAVVLSPFKWVEVDVQLTADGIPILFHDDTVEREGEALFIDSITLDTLRSLSGYGQVLSLEQALELYGENLNFLIEIKPLRHVSRIMGMTSEVSRIIRQHQSDSSTRLIVDSFQQLAAQSIKKQCDCEVGIDTPYGLRPTSDQFRHLREIGMDWIYVHESVVDGNLIREAHAHGLKLMIYTVNNPSVIEALGAELPDGIITDVLVMAEFVPPKN